MALHGLQTSIYLQKGLIEYVDKALEENPYSYQSRNQFINSAIVRELRRLKIIDKEVTDIWQDQEQKK